MKAQTIDGKVFRMRRGKLVEIPEQWVGQFPHKQTMNKRRSKKTEKMKKTH